MLIYSVNLQSLFIIIYLLCDNKSKFDFDFFYMGYILLTVTEPVLSSNELDEVQYNISTPGSFAFAERPNGSVS